MEEKKTAGLIGEDVKTLPIGQLLKRIGPGLIATGIVIGPGAVTTAAMLGANYGYALIWLMFPIIFMGITFVMTTNWLAINIMVKRVLLLSVLRCFLPVCSSLWGIFPAPEQA